MKQVFTKFGFVVAFYLIGSPVFAQNNFWSNVSEAAISKNSAKKGITPALYRTLILDTARLTSLFLETPKEFTSRAKNTPSVVMLPFPDGSFKRFSIVKTSMMEPALAARFPNIKTFAGQGIDDPYATIKIDWSPSGFHAMILSPVSGAVFIDPYSDATATEYIAYNKKDVRQTQTFIEKGKEATQQEPDKRTAAQRTAANQCVGGTLRQYRLAVACTGEYAQKVGGGTGATVETVFPKIVTTINRVNGVYESEVGIRLVLVANNTQIVFTNPDTDPFTGNNDGEVLIDESENEITTRIGSENFDIGHTFSTRGGGLANVGVVCRNGNKASGVTGSPNPVGDPYDIDYVAHEIGHQFGATHTFNANTAACTNQGASNSNVEPGSGSTIMAYAGICGSENNLQANSDAFFHALSFSQITDYIINGAGKNCAQILTTGNTSPVVNVGADYTIPKSTPFVLTGSATDANDNNSLTYCWEEMNAGGLFGDWNDPAGNAPIFRSFAPVNTPQRYFPKLTDILNNTTTIGEFLPAYSRNLNFRLTVRDNHSGGGGVCSDDMTVVVNDKAGPFIVTAPNTATTWDAGSFKTITWDVANTNTTPVNCANVTIELSTDGGSTFPIILIASTPNDGSEEITVPSTFTNAARIRIKAVGNIFFDISNENFTIRFAQQSEFVFNNPPPVSKCDNSNAFTVLNTSTLNGFSTPITLSASGNPAGTSVVFSANPISPGNSTTITIQGALAQGTYNITITGKAGSDIKTRVIKFTKGAPVDAPVLSGPPDNTVIYSLNPTFSWQITASAVTYNLQISTTPRFSTSQTINDITGTSYAVSTPLNDNTAYYWRVFSNNSCGSGPASSAFLFKTAAINCADTINSTNVPLTIPEAIDTSYSTLNIPAGGIIEDVDVVGLKGTHAYVSDLTVSLVSPANTSVTLFTSICAEMKDFDLNFNDEAASEDIPCPPTTGESFKPIMPLSAFDNQNSTGTWTLKIADHFADDGGSLTNWGLRICTYMPTSLPVNWLTFTGYKNENNTVSLQWSTANEANNRHYEIERSSDGIHFNSIGNIEAGNNPGTLQQYLFNDVKAFTGINYYRLKQVDKDGRINYSTIVRVVVANSKGALYTVYPNPAIEKTTVRMLADLKQLTVRFNDVSGKVLYQKSLQTVKTGEEIRIPLSGFSKGLYLLTITTDKGTTAEKVVVQ